VVICLERGADLHMAQLMPLPLTVSCFSKIQIGFTFLVPAHPRNPGKRADKRVCDKIVNYTLFLFLEIIKCAQQQHLFSALSSRTTRVSLHQKPRLWGLIYKYLTTILR